MDCDILYKDTALVVCVKPAGVSSESGGMPERLAEQLGGEIYCVHRLDKAVGGVMVYARSRKAAAALSGQVAGRKIIKEYLAVTQGRPTGESGVLRDLLYHDAARNKSYVVRRPRRGVKEAELSYTCLETRQTEEGELSLLRIRLHTGRSHQIRVQLASRKLPLAGDRRYGGHGSGDGPALWSERLCFQHPDSGEAMDFRRLPPPSAPWNYFGESYKTCNE